MKYLTVAIPSYNSEAYMAHAIESCLICGDDVEVIVVNDGSKDNTGKIGDEYAAKYPDIVKCIHQENGGHGEAVNTGLKNATGLYYKVLDSDDWFDEAALLRILNQLKKLHEENNDVDMMIANYVYDKPSENKITPITYKRVLPENRVFRWYNVGRFAPSQNLLMHSVYYRTKLLRDCGLVLPKHTFYVDNIFVYQPLPYVKTMYYMNENAYHYFIGREDQSVNEKVMISRIDQQIRVNNIMIDSCDIMALKSRELKAYMLHYLTMICTVTTVLLIRSGVEENLEKKREFWALFEERNPELHKAVKHTLLGAAMQMDSKVGRSIISTGYKIAQKLFNFN